MLGRLDSLRTKADSTRRRVEAERARLDSRRPTSRVVDVMFGSAEIHQRAGGGLLAGAIAFRLFLFIVPCVFVIVMVLGIGIDLADLDPRDAAQEAGIVGLIATAIQAGADATSRTQWVTLVVALVALAFGAVNLLKAMLVAHGLIWQVPTHRPRSWTRASFVLVGTVLGAAAVLWAVSRLRALSFGGWVVGLAVYVVVPAGVWLVFSARWLPAADRAGWRDLWPGALIFGVGAELLQVLTVVWISQSLESKSETFGAIGAALTILFWAYLLGRLVTAAAAVNAGLWRSRHRDAASGVGNDSPGSDDDALAEPASLSVPEEGVGSRRSG